MRIRFLLGPAGSGKTCRCLDEIRAELLRSPDGPPLLCLAPKQATFQLERRLLEGGAEPLAGWSRLQILSFDRLARQLLTNTRPVSLLAEEGRLMVLRALLRRHGPELRVFRSTARLNGFAQELSATLRELQCHQVGPSRLADLAQRPELPTPLTDKLHDLGLLLRAYGDWLTAHELIDGDALPDLATEALRHGTAVFGLEALWLDGFAEMTPQELDLLSALAARSKRSTLAFCLDREPREDAPWLSPWSVVSQTFRNCHGRLSSLPGAHTTVELFPDPGAPTRFEGRPALAHLAAHWSQPAAAEGPAAAHAETSLRLVSARDFEREAEIAAREIRRHVRGGGRFREVAVLVRHLEPVQATLERVFLRYEIPFFLDRREPLAHHPLADLTRSAVRLAAFGWAHEDWFAALKTNLTGASPLEVDRWENEALAAGWDGRFWRRLAATPLGEGGPGFDMPGAPTALHRVLAPFARLVGALESPPSGTELAASLRQLWADLEVTDTLEAWSDDGLPSAVLHRAAGDQLRAWLENLERGFGNERLPLPEWLPVIEAGLGSLTAGVIPPAQDQVLIGAIDRSRQPDLCLAIVAGLNEGRFPAPPGPSGLLTELDREQLEGAGAWLGANRRRRVGHERYFGYIACTRARDRLVLTWSERDDAGRPLNASPFVRLVQSLFPRVPISDELLETVPPDLPATGLPERLEHAVELLPWLFARAQPTPIDGLAGDDLRRAWLRSLRSSASSDSLAPTLARALFGPEPEVSVSALESLAACPFQFFVRHALRGREREEFEADARQVGSLAHELLARFHQGIQADQLQWRDVSPEQARARFDALAPAVVQAFARGVAQSTPDARWQTQGLLNHLREVVAVLVGWAPGCAFNPTAAELAFGGQSALPAWRIEVDRVQALRIRGKADRVDVLRTGDGTTRFLVIDYKLRLPRLDDALIAAGIDLQLAAYALALATPDTRWQPAAGDGPRVPAGMFYVGLRGRPPGASSRVDAVDPPVARAALHVHRGRYPELAVDWLDRGGVPGRGRQFAITRNKDGSLRQGGDGRTDAAFAELLACAAGSIRRLGEAIFRGATEVAPFGRGRQNACQYCDLAQVCRFDAWTQRFRRVV